MHAVHDAIVMLVPGRAPSSPHMAHVRAVQSSAYMIVCDMP